MRALLALLLTVAVAAETPEQAARGLLQRILPKGRDEEFIITITGGDEKDTFGIDNAAGDKIELTGTNAGSIAAALNWYLKYTADCQVSWAGDNLNLAKPLPKVSEKVSLTRPYQYGYYENVCTVSYTMAFWQWDRWEREIDWMAMNGINMPLAFTGQEYVWQKTFEFFGLTAADLDPFFSGPAFFAWQRMGNIKGWGGPLPQDFINERMQLQIKTLARMRSLGMTPVLPAFAGHIPEALTHKYSVNYTRSPDWGGFSDQYGRVFYLDNTDPMFVKIGNKFIELQASIYGTDHLYNADQYNEMTPPSTDLGFLKGASEAMYNSMIQADPKAIWVMQGWLFVNDPNWWTQPRVQSYLSGVPDKNMIILDLFSDVVPCYPESNSYYGKPYIWNMLHNFGGNVGLYGRMPVINTEPHLAKNTTIVGVGLTPEGTLQNYPVYDLMMENAWRSEPTNLPTWITNYHKRRYGKTTPNTIKGWLSILNTVYNASKSAGWGVTKSVIEVRPSMNMDHGGFMPTHLYYDPATFVTAVGDILKDHDQFSHLETYQNDAVDLMRQALSNKMLELSANHTAAYKAKNQQLVQSIATEILQLIKDFDKLLGSNSHFLLGKWIEDARSWGTVDKNADFFEWNARNQITLWGPKGEITDYASKQWSGLVSDYYYPRWELYLKTVNTALKEGKAFNQSAFDTNCRVLEQSWQHGTETFPSQPVGDAVQIAVTLYQQYFA
eukprot:TRINITY_DN857_c3_g1_i1.p1 TRINITY_DN857_c3_g1~~TRINITY_DN857_c3_g1_i1.p1  ORF type:complete len:723 (+),score=163.84 TRINITY_DN857_c3_g1_i1:77-2245(+)